MDVIINDVKVNYTKAGSKGRDVILMHGWGQNIEMMKPIADHLSDDFIVYNIDLPGFGESEKPQVVSGVEEYSEMLEKFIIKNAINNPIIIAHSFGVRIALLYAAHNPVYKLVLTGGAGIIPKRGLKYYLKTYIYKFGKLVLSLPGLGQIKENFQKKSGSADYQALDGMMRDSFVKIVNLDISPYLKDVKAETLLVWGEDDDATPLWMGKKMEKEIPNAGLAIFENEGHYAYWNQMPRFLSVIDIFLKEDRIWTY